MINRKIILGLSFLGSLAVAFAWYLDKVNSKMCYNTSLLPYGDICEMFFNIFAIFILIFFTCLIIYFIKKESVFKSWKKFTIIYLFIYLFIYLLAPQKCDAYTNLVCKEGAFSVFVPLYLFLSIILILYKSFKKDAK